MRHPSRSSAATKEVVAILGSGTLSEEILAGLLEERGYATRHLEAPPTDHIEELLEDVDVVLLAPSHIKAEEHHEAFLIKAMRSTQEESAAIPVLPLSSALKLALLDEMSAGASWRTLFEELTSQIGAALGRAAMSAGALVAECCGVEPLFFLPLLRQMPSKEPQRQEVSLPPGYTLDHTDPEILLLRSPEGDVVARFSASGYAAEVVEREAWEDHRQRKEALPPTPLPSGDKN